MDWLDLQRVIRRIVEEPRGMGRLAYGLASAEINIKAGRIIENVHRSV